MRLLIDSHLFLWAVSDSSALSKKARETIDNPSNAILVSLATAWELAIKIAVGKLRINGDIESAIRDNGFEPLPILFSHIRQTLDLPMHHGDPFDRMLIAQAMAEGLTLLTHDRRLAAYGPFVRVV